MPETPTAPRPERRTLRRLLVDPRHYQIAVLSTLLLYGVTRLDIAITPAYFATLLATALATQWLAGRLVGLARFDPRSPLISTLSLALLLRTGSLPLAALAAAVTIGSKFVLRARGKHIFNPTNFGLVAMLVVTDRAWVSHGQWGSAAFYGFFAACLGGLVVHRAARADVTWAFLASYLALLFGRALYLGDPLAIPLHQMESGALLIFTFFMISDPKTTPDSRPGRIVFAALVAAVAYWFRFFQFDPNGLLYALVLSAPAVPLIDRLLPDRQYRWPGEELLAARRERARRPKPLKETAMQPRASTLSLLLAAALVAGLTLAAAPPAAAFCGFYVARADADLFNRASQVALVRDGDRTVLTMANDYQGDLDEFAIVIPVPTFLEKEQIHVADNALIDHLDAYTGPRLVEYFDPDPCRRLYDRELMQESAAPPPPASAASRDRAKSLGVTIEAEYTVGEYDILILSAEESNGLVTWLKESGYRLPRGAEPVVGSYLKQGLRFFVAKVNLAEQSRLGFSYLRPLQVAFESKKFMLPIRLGTLNADGPQDLLIYTLTRTGRVETTNYRTVRLPTDMDVPVFVKDDFGRFYKEMFAHQVEKEKMRAVFLEYAWDMNWCDPCAADPLSDRELQELGVFWIDGRRMDGQGSRRMAGPAKDVFVTRLHVRYDAEHFPEDLFFQETGDRGNFQGRYVMRHAFSGDLDCPGGDEYLRRVAQRDDAAAQNLANLTGWPIGEIRNRMGMDEEPDEPKKPWWRRIWGDDGR